MRMDQHNISKTHKYLLTLFYKNILTGSILMYAVSLYFVIKSVKLNSRQIEDKNIVIKRKCLKRYQEANLTERHSCISNVFVNSKFNKQSSFTNIQFLVFWCNSSAHRTLRGGGKVKAKKQHHSQEAGGSCDLLPGKHHIQRNQIASVVALRSVRNQSLKKILQKHRTELVYVSNSA